MTVKYELDNEDISKIIAEYFKVNEKDVSLRCKSITVGIGVNEHNIYVPICEVAKKD